MSSDESTEEPNESIDMQKICRGCLKRHGEMKDMYKSRLYIDFFKYTDIPKEPALGMPSVLCATCEVDLKNVRRFRERCHESDVALRRNLKKKANHVESHKNHVSSILYNNKLTYMITAPNPNHMIHLQCPYAECKAHFTKKKSLILHLTKNHEIDDKEFEIEQQFYCSETNCFYNMNSNPNKYFTARKFLNQHTNKMHKDKIYTCGKCNQTYSVETAYYRHLKTCNCVYECVFCQRVYNNSETYLVHLKRKHPNLHEKYKSERKEIRKLEKANFVATPPPPEPILQIPVPKLTKKAKDKKDIKNKDAPKEKKIRKKAKNNKKTKQTFKDLINPINSHVESELNEGVPKEPAPIEITRFPPWELKINGFGIPHIDLSQARVGQPDAETVQQVIEEIGQFPTPIDNDTAVKVFEADIATALNNSFENVIVEECFTEDYIEEEVEIADKKDTTEDVEMECLKKTSATQIPEDISANDVSLPPWSHKVDFEIQTDEMSTQTVFEDLLSMKSQNEDDFFSESVSLSDIQTQTLPIEWLRCHKETQACTSEASLSIKETQTCFCLFDSKPNFKLFDSLSSSPASSNFISTETQTVDRICDSHPVRSDVLLSFSSAETQTYFDDSSNGGINGSM